MKVIIHNSVSLDGSFTGFQPNMELHYRIAGKYRPDVHLIGSVTAKVGIELYGENAAEEEADFHKRERGKNLPYWVIPDTKGILTGLLHNFRKFEFCRDVIVLVSKSTPKEYLEYLDERKYNYHKVGNKHVHLKRALALLSKKYAVKTVLTDTGRILGNLLLDQGLVSEISLLTHPVIVGKKEDNLFNTLDTLKLKLKKSEVLEKQYVWSVYEVS